MFDSNAEEDDRPRKLYGIRRNLLDTVTDNQLRKRYLFNADEIRDIVRIVDADIRRPTHRGYAISSELQVLTALDCLAGHRLTRH